MRSDQVIGLTARAKVYIENLRKSDRFIREEKIEIGNFAFDEQKVVGVKIYLKSQYSANKEEYFEEIIQMEPWSSGPMYFTCLKHVIVKEMNSQVLELGKCYEWTKDPMIEGEFDYSLGAYNL